MARYLFYPSADASQDRIWRETVEKWGDAQAEVYMTGLHRHLQKICETRSLWRRLPQQLVVPQDLEAPAYFIRYRHHDVFFRELSGSRIGIMSILHERMDLSMCLAEDLHELQRREPDDL
jgi:plasmid stabilization system protein ParE